MLRSQRFVERQHELVGCRCMLISVAQRNVRSATIAISATARSIWTRFSRCVVLSVVLSVVLNVVRAARCLCADIDDAQKPVGKCTSDYFCTPLVRSVCSLCFVVFRSNLNVQVIKLRNKNARRRRANATGKKNTDLARSIELSELRHIVLDIRMYATIQQWIRGHVWSQADESVVTTLALTEKTNCVAHLFVFEISGYDRSVSSDGCKVFFFFFFLFHF